MFNGGRVEVRMCISSSRATRCWFVIDAQNVSVVFGGQGINFVVTQQFCSRGPGAPRRWWVLRDASMPFLLFVLLFLSLMIRVTPFSWTDNPVGPHSRLYVYQYDL